MRIVTRLLLIGLLACGLSYAVRVAPLPQQPGTVAVRPQATSTPPGVPEVKVSSDRNRVPVGAEVTFTLSPARVISDPRYRVTLFFGDGNRQVMRQTSVSHVYSQAGTYTYSVLVEPEKQSTPTPTPLPPLPGVKLAVSPTSVEVNQPVSFSAQLSRPYQNLKYRFVFGDGSDTGWQDDSRASHTYRTANTFRAYVDIGVFSNGSVKQAGGSERGAVRVTEPPRQVNATVKLSASPTSIESGKSVRFTARVSPQSSTVRYRFDFGDNSGTDWQANSSATHRYTAAGRYSARVELRIADRTNAPQTASDSTTIDVREPQGKSTVDLKVIPATVPLGVPILFEAVPSVASGKAVYRFNFGDGSAPADWSSATVRPHIYSAAGDYPAFVEMAISGSEPIASGKKRVRITPIGPVPNANDNRISNPSNNANSNATPRLNTNNNGNSNGNGSSGGVTNANTNVSPAASQNPQGTKNAASTDWWKYLIIAAIILFVGYQAYSYFFAPRPKFVPRFDPGDSKVAPGKPCSIGLQLDVDPNILDGDVRIDTQGKSLIKSKRIEP